MLYWKNNLKIEMEVNVAFEVIFIEFLIILFLLEDLYATGCVPGLRIR